jgi:hypothetical protein
MPNRRFGDAEEEIWHAVDLYQPLDFRHSQAE